MANLYVLMETLRFFKEDKDGFPMLERFECNIRGVFDNMKMIREFVINTLDYTYSIVGENNVYRENLTDIWYTTFDGLKAHLEYKVTAIDKINEELTSYLSIDDES